MSTAQDVPLCEHAGPIDRVESAGCGSMSQLAATLHSA